MDTLRFFVGKTYRRLVDPTDPQDRLMRIFHIVAHDEADDSVEFVHYYEFQYEPDADEFLEKVEAAEGLDREHLETSEHWEQGPRDTRTSEERFIDECHREMREVHNRLRVY
jgi:hypothetical protein